MHETKIQQLNDVFDELAEQLNITPTMQEKAIRSYGYVGEWLGGGYTDADVYPQGSFALGTVVRPISGEDGDYDIDLVCQMPQFKNAEARAVKHAAGNRIKEHRLLSKKLEQEGKRCWTLEYDGFHMDILPCSPDKTPNNEEYANGRIRLTHKLPSGIYEDRFSDPKGYQSWFESRMTRVLCEERARMARVQNRMVEDVKTYETRTPLQKAIQILKHHRNMMFEGEDDAPISIMITTLAALSYEGEPGTFEALCAIVSRMRSHITRDNGRHSIKNPVDEREDYADKWVSEPQKERNFFLWLNRVEQDFSEGAFAASGLNKIGAMLNSSVGEIMSKRTLDSYASSFNTARNNGSLFASAAGLSTVATIDSVPVPKHSFYGATVD